MSKKILIIGGTGNMGHYLAKTLAEAGADLTILNRGITKDELPDSVHRLHADRKDSMQLRRALLAKSFDIVVDFVMYRADEAEAAVELFRGGIDHYIMISSGQVYLVREGAQRPFGEEDYEGRVMPAPKENSFAYEEWRYGMGKREAEDRLRQAWMESNFPQTILRLPMVNSGRDPFNRFLNYYLRLQDGGEILVPETPNFALNHIYALDVVTAIVGIIHSGEGKGQVFNISQDETVSLDEFLAITAELMNTQARIVRVERSQLEANGFLPDCSPFSERWMSELDNSRSKAALGMTYTPLRDYLARLVEFYSSHQTLPPFTYRRRRAELQFAKQSA